MRFVEDDWESPTLGAWGLGWEVWLDGMEVHAVHLLPAGGRLRVRLPCPSEIAYGLERLTMYIQGVDSRLRHHLEPAATTAWSSPTATCILENEREFSAYNFEVADTDLLFERLRPATRRECQPRAWSTACRCPPTTAC